MTRLKNDLKDVMHSKSVRGWACESGEDTVDTNALKTQIWGNDLLFVANMSLNQLLSLVFRIH